MLKKTVIKVFWLIGGIIFLTIGIACLLTPIVPQLIFFILSLVCFMQASQRFKEWVHKQHWYERIKKHMPSRHNKK